MLTKNFYSYMRAAFHGTTAYYTTTDGVTKGASFSNEYTPFKVMNRWSESVTGIGVSFGTGTRPATVSDYFLQSILTSSKIDVAAPGAVSFSQGDTYDEYSVTFVVTNKTADAITISEVGLTAVPYYAGTNTSYNYYALVDRTVLETPITIPAGQSKQITYTIRFNYGA